MSRSPRMLLPLLIGALVSCGGTDKSTQPSSPVGVFQLISIDGNPLPAGFGSSFDLRSDGTFIDTERNAGTTTFTSSGSYAFAPASTNFIILTVLQTNGGTAVGPCATRCTGTCMGNVWLLVPSPLPPSTGFGAGWRYE